MRKFSTVYLLAAVVMLGSCARDYATYKHAPGSAYVSSRTETPVVTKAAPVEVTEAPTFEALTTNPEVVKMLSESSPRQIDEQLETALATTQGQKLMANPLIASRIGNARAMLAKIDTKRVDAAAVAGSPVVSKMVNKQLTKAMAPAAAKALDGKVTAGIILILLGIVLGLIPAVGWLIGGIVTAIGIVLIVLGLLG